VQFLTPSAFEDPGIFLQTDLCIGQYIVDKDTELGQFIVEFQKLDSGKRDRLMGYFNALKDM
jgi:hypothetical protein